MKHGTMKKNVTNLGNNETQNNEKRCSKVKEQWNMKQWKRAQPSKKVVKTIEAKQGIVNKGVMEQGKKKKESME